MSYVRTDPLSTNHRYYQQCLDKDPLGYCGLGGTGLSCPLGMAKTEG